MHIAEDSLDDIMREVLGQLLNSNNKVSSSRGDNSEIVGTLIELHNPLARLSRTEAKGTIFSCLGELLWYLSKSNDLAFIQHYISDYSQYSDDGKTIFGGYGPRLFKMRGEINQIQNIINLLRENPSSRRAAIQLFDAHDLTEPHTDIPCTCNLQFLVRDSKLHMVTFMRSNDAYLGLPHDIFGELSC